MIDIDKDIEQAVEHALNSTIAASAFGDLESTLLKLAMVYLKGKANPAEVLIRIRQQLAK